MSHWTAYYTWDTRHGHLREVPQGDALSEWQLEVPKFPVTLQLPKKQRFLPMQKPKVTRVAAMPSVRALGAALVVTRSCLRRLMDGSLAMDGVTVVRQDGVLCADAPRPYSKRPVRMGTLWEQMLVRAPEDQSLYQATVHTMKVRPLHSASGRSTAVPDSFAVADTPLTKNGVRVAVLCEIDAMVRDRPVEVKLGTRGKHFVQCFLAGITDIYCGLADYERSTEGGPLHVPEARWTEPPATKEEEEATYAAFEKAIEALLCAEHRG